MSTGQEYDVIVIGGGASGMMAAGAAAARGLKVLLIEKNKELGRKLSITGGGRCNILNGEEDTRLLLENYGEAAKYLHSPFHSTLCRTRVIFLNRGASHSLLRRANAYSQRVKMLRTSLGL
jgi:predicted flavoprotein YhiN